MSRSRWLVLLGPPFVALAAAAIGGALLPGTALGGPPAAAPTASLGACPGQVAPRPAPGTAWHRDPILDPDGSLAGWVLRVATPGGSERSLRLPAASVVTGPDAGRVVVSQDDGAHSSVALVDVGRGCVTTIGLGPVVARRAVADPDGRSVLVHLLERGSRADLGVFRVAPDGRRDRLVGPPPGAALAAAGIRRTWATNLLPSLDGGRLVVQSCDPSACLTRIVDLRDGTVWTAPARLGRAVGLVGERLVAMTPCEGLPCPVLAADLAAGSTSVLEPAASAAMLARDGRVVTIVAGTTGAGAFVLDPRSGSRTLLGPVPADADPTGPVDASVEGDSSFVGLVRADRSILRLSLAPGRSGDLARPEERR